MSTTRLPPISPQQLAELQAYARQHLPAVPDAQPWCATHGHEPFSDTYPRCKHCDKPLTPGIQSTVTPALPAGVYAAPPVLPRTVAPRVPASRVPVPREVAEAIEADLRRTLAAQDPGLPATVRLAGPAATIDAWASGDRSALADAPFVFDVRGSYAGDPSPARSPFVGETELLLALRDPNAFVRR